MFIAGIIFIISCVALFFICKSNWLRILASVLVITVGVVFVNQWIAQHKADQVEDNTTDQFGRGYDDNYLGSDNSSTEFNESTMSGDNNQSDNYSSSNQSSQTNSGRNVKSNNNKSNNSKSNNSNNNNSSRKTIGLKDKYLKELKELEKKTDDICLNSGQSMADISCTGVDISKLWDDELNVIYQEIRSRMSSSEREALKQEEINWLKYRDKTAEEAGDEYRGGSMQGLVISSSLAELTKDRCYELVNKYMN